VRTGEVKLLVLLTKADKLNRKEQAESLAKAQQALGDVVTDEADVGIALFSALNKTGVGDVAQVLQGWSELTEALRERLAMPGTLPPESGPESGADATLSEGAPEGSPDQPA